MLLFLVSFIFTFNWCDCLFSMKFNIFQVFISVNFLFHFHKTDCLVVKWITQNTFKNGNYLKLEQNVSLHSKEAVCIWYMLNENAAVDASGTIHGDSFIYMNTPKECNLLIRKYDNKTHFQLDYYKSVLKNTDINTETYTLGYLKSFSLKRIQHNSSLVEYICELKLSFADSSDEKLIEMLNKEIQNLVSIQNSQIPGKSTSKRSLKANGDFKRFEKRQNKFILDYIFSESKFIDYKNLTNKNDMKCDLTLFDGRNKMVVAYFQSLVTSVTSAIMNVIKNYILKNQTFLLNSLF